MRRRAALVTLVLLGAPLRLQAQSAPRPNVDSLTTVLASPDADSWAQAVVILATVNPSLIPPQTRASLISLLERLATRRVAPPESTGEDTADGENLIQLVRLVARLQDPAATRALALGGLTVNLASQRFVASQGDAALPYLLEAEALDTMQRGAVTITRAYMLGEFGSRLSPAGRVTTMAAILRTALADPTTFAHAAQLAGMVTAVPLVQQLVTNEPPGLTRTLLVDALDSLSTLRSQRSLPSVLSDLASTLDAVCSEAQGARIDACQSISNLLADATKQLLAQRSIPARNVMDAFSNRVTNAVQQGAFESWEGLLMSGTAAYVRTRI
jgi:hypothetical protein